MTKLADALRNLDPTNDKHWTSDGAPAVEAVRELSGEAQLTRKDITEAAPTLARATFAEWLAKLDEPEDEVQGPAPDADKSPTHMEVLRLQELEQTLTREVFQKQQALRKCQEDLTRAIEAHEAAYPKPSPMESIMAHVRAQHEERLKRAGIPAPASGAAPIDAAFQYRRHQQGINNGFQTAQAAAKPSA